MAGDKLHFRKDASGKTACGTLIRPGGWTPSNSNPEYIMTLWESDRHRLVCARCIPAARAQRGKDSAAGGAQPAPCQGGGG